MSEMLNIGRYDRDGRFTGDAWKWLMELARACRSLCRVCNDGIRQILRVAAGRHACCGTRH